jgi:hypothetical protein
MLDRFGRINGTYAEIPYVGIILLLGYYSLYHTNFTT